jgi:hypothetical protein
MTGCRSKVLVVSPLRPSKEKADTMFVGNPLDMIEVLQEARETFSTVVLTGRYAANPELAAYLASNYPALSIVSGAAGEEPDPYLPTYS